jgi:two-component system chemotaxis response regulator CheB
VTAAVVIGASAGAVEALSVILPALPAGYPVPVAVVVHLPPDRPSIMAELFAARCRVAVREAEDKEPLVPGTVYFAPPDYHLLVEAAGHLSLSSEEPVRFSRPSIDVLFESAADAVGPGLVAVVLTGANDDGAAGLRAVCAAGGAAVVQDPLGAQAGAMPAAALAACPGATVLSLPQIAAYLTSLGEAS